MHENPRMSSGFLVLPVSMLLLLLGMVFVIATIGDAVAGSEANVQPTTIAQGATESAAAAPPTATPTAEATAEAQPVDEEVINFDTRVVQTGRSLFQSTCASCHGSNARGIPGLGKDVIDSEFVRGLNDEELLNFIIVGRSPTDPLNTTGIIMPARGANPALSDEQIQDIIVFIRSEAQNLFGTAYLGDTSAAAPAAPQAEVAPAPTEDPNFVLPIVLLGLEDAEPIEPPIGEAASLYNQLCAGCHGLAGEGVENLGTALVGDPTAADADALLTFLSTHQPIDLSWNSFTHPTRFVFPILANDESLRALVDYTVALVAES